MIHLQDWYEFLHETKMGSSNVGFLISLRNSLHISYFFPVSIPYKTYWVYLVGSFSSALKEIQFHVLLQIMASAFSPFSFDIFATSEMPLLTGHAEQHALLPQCRDTLE